MLRLPGAVFFFFFFRLDQTFLHIFSLATILFEFILDHFLNPSPHQKKKKHLQIDVNFYVQLSSLMLNFGLLECSNQLVQFYKLSFLHCRKIANKVYQGTTWQIKFNLHNVNRIATYKLRVALASAALSELQV